MLMPIMQVSLLSTSRHRCLKKFCVEIFSQGFVGEFLDLSSTFLKKYSQLICGLGLGEWHRKLQETMYGCPSAWLHRWHKC